MRYRFFILLFVFSLSACSFNVDVVTPPPSATVPPIASPTLVYPSDIAPLPSATFTPVASSTPLQENAGVYPIKFAPNGTYVDTLDSLSAGTSKTFSVSAMQGQVMSVSIRVDPNNTWTVVPLKIVGTDGSVLCPTQANWSCYFWRGTLPATQEYLITLSPETDVTDFILRVAIDPPGTTSQLFSYRSIDSVMLFTYTDEFAPALFPAMYTTKTTPEVALQFIDTKSLDNTNLSEAYFLFGTSDDAEVVTSCTQPASFGGEEIIIGEVNIGGIPFTHSKAVGLGAGNAYEQTYYRTVYQGSCYEITLFMHSTNIGNYAPDSGIREFDRTALTQKFEAILSTFVTK